MSYPTCLLEVALSSVDDARSAEQSGADRLELNAALSLGGLTPSLGTLLAVKATTRLPVMVMIRPRAGGFVYSPAEFAVMERDAELAVAHGADGIVFGILTADGTVDVPRCRQLLSRLGTCPAVFHRAFDGTLDPFRALDELIDLGFRRVLTSGQQPTALAGADLIARLREQAADRLEILPGAGVTPASVVELLARTGCTQVHGTFREVRSDPVAVSGQGVSFGPHEGLNAGLVAEVRRRINRLVPREARETADE